VRLVRTYLLRFQEPDGSVPTDVLYRKSDSAGLVDPDDRPLSTTEPFVMYGREWQVVDVHVTQRLIRILCVSTALSPSEAVHVPSADSATT
jgi:hypothetical protein